MAVAELLLQYNADVELPDNYGQSPLFMACWKGLSLEFTIRCHGICIKDLALVFDSPISLIPGEVRPSLPHGSENETVSLTEQPCCCV